MTESMIEGTILLVEDNADDEALTLRALAKHRIGHRVIVARDGVEALDYLLGDSAASLAQLPHLVLLDLKLPRIDGLEVLSRLRSDERTRLLPVVILTSSVEEEDVVKGYSFGANSYIRKPVDFAEFSEVVKRLGIYWLVLNRRPPDRRGS